MSGRLREAASVAPSPRQLAWQQMEFYGFIHFGMNTFTDREWGDGTASPALFDPAHLDPDQWAGAPKSAGMRGLILTCKHHDGFCLWPSAHTGYSVKNAPWKNGRGDVVGETAAACRRAGLKFGVYLSPWDRHDPHYGTGKPYDDYYVAQLTELLTQYGELFCVWLVRQFPALSWGNTSPRPAHRGRLHRGGRTPRRLLYRGGPQADLPFYAGDGAAPHRPHHRGPGRTGPPAGGGLPLTLLFSDPSLYRTPLPKAGKSLPVIKRGAFVASREPVQISWTSRAKAGRTTMDSRVDTTTLPAASSSS